MANIDTIPATKTRGIQVQKGLYRLNSRFDSMSRLPPYFEDETKTTLFVDFFPSASRAIFSKASFVTFSISDFTKPLAKIGTLEKEKFQDASSLVFAPLRVTSFIFLDPTSGPSVISISIVELCGLSLTVWCPVCPMNPTSTSRSITFPSLFVTFAEFRPFQYSDSLPISEIMLQTLSGEVFISALALIDIIFVRLLQFREVILLNPNPNSVRVFGHLS